MRTNHNIIIGDSRQMDYLKNRTIQLVVTSPPYWQLKDYGTGDQIGYHEDYQTYVNNLNLVWKECFRVLEDGCRLCVNIGDQFARAVYYGRYKVIPIRTEIIKFCESIGFDYMGAIIWQKKTTTNTTGGASLMGSYPTPRNGILSIDYEFILIFKKLGKAKKVSKEIKEQSKMTKQEWKEYFQGHWNFAGAKQNGHIAMFPEELPHRLIKMFSFVEDTVLDPFLGSGTTSSVAKKLNRNSVGFEINPDYKTFIAEKIGSKSSLFEQNEIKFHQQALVKNFEDEVKKSPYIFKDFHRLDKKTDPKKLSFGSKIDKQTSEDKEFYRVQEVISPTLIRLNNDLVVRLLGVKEVLKISEKAIRFLKDKTANQKVFLKVDRQKHDSSNNILAYVYLKNKTFLNAHLIKNGLAIADTEEQYKNKTKFEQLQENYEGYAI